MFVSNTVVIDNVELCVKNIRSDDIKLGYWRKKIFISTINLDLSITELLDRLGSNKIEINFINSAIKNMIILKDCYIVDDNETKNIIDIIELEI